MSKNLTANDVKKLYKDKKLIPFIGAGLSRCFNLPSWEELTDIIAKELNYDPEVFMLSGNFWQLAGYYKAKKGGIGELRSLLDKQFTPSDKQISLSRSHIALTKMKLPVIYTTNFDNIIERAFKLHRKKFRLIRNLRDISEKGVDSLEIVKFHGSFEDDSTLVLTESDYFNRLDFEMPLDIKLRADILGRTLLFIGYSFADINLRYMLHKLNKLNKLPEGERSLQLGIPAAIMTTFDSDDVQKVLLREWNVETIELNPVDKTNSLADFL